MSTTSHKLSALQAELDAKENDAQTQRQQKEQAGKYEERLRALNTEIRTLRKRQNEYTQPSLSLASRPQTPGLHTPHPPLQVRKLSKLNADRSKEISKLQGQISEMKHAKVAIQRKASEESSQYRDWRQARMREISQLRREARVSKLEHHRLLSAHAKQEAIAKRRTEVVAAVQRPAPRAGQVRPRHRRAAAAPTRRATRRRRPAAASSAGSARPRVARRARRRWRRRSKASSRGGCASARAASSSSACPAARGALLAARRDAARERKALLESRGNDAEAREIDDEIESLEAQLEVKASRGSSTRRAARGARAAAAAARSPTSRRARSPRRSSRSSSKVGCARRSLAGGWRRSASSATPSPRRSAPRSSRRSRRRSATSRRSTRAAGPTSRALQAVIESRTEDADDAAAPAAAGGARLPRHDHRRARRRARRRDARRRRRTTDDLEADRRAQRRDARLAQIDGDDPRRRARSPAVGTSCRSPRAVREQRA